MSFSTPLSLVRDPSSAAQAPEAQALQAKRRQQLISWLWPDSARSLPPQCSTEQEEKDLYKAILNCPDLNYKNISEIENLVKPLNNFFDKVLVMDKDEKIKNNRLNLLSSLALKFKNICDFSKIGSK